MKRMKLMPRYGFGTLSVSVRHELGSRCSPRVTTSDKRFLGVSPRPTAVMPSVVPALDLEDQANGSESTILPWEQIVVVD